MKTALTILALALLSGPALAGQAPGAASAPDVPVSGKDRFYTSDQFSNTVSVVDPPANTLLGVIRLGDPTPMNLSPLYRGQLLVHGMGFSRGPQDPARGLDRFELRELHRHGDQRGPPHRLFGRSPHEAFFTPDGREVWVSVRGEDHIAVLDAATAKETRRITVPNGPGMTIFSPDGTYGYVCSSFSPETVVIDTKTHTIVGRVKQESPFCPDIAATPTASRCGSPSRMSAAPRCFRRVRPSRR